MEYAVLVSVLVLSMIAMQTMIKRAISYKWKAAIDSTFATEGRQYDPAPGATSVVAHE